VAGSGSALVWTHRAGFLGREPPAPLYHELVPKNTNMVPRADVSPARSATAAERKLKATERKAAKLVEAATAEAERLRREVKTEADRLRGEARADAARALAEANERARGLVLDARATAEGVRAEGMEIVSNLREMSDALHANAERLLQDIQGIHSRMVSELDRVDPERGSGGDASGAAPASEAGNHEPSSAGSEEQLDVPDFIPRR
jgi:uncharacterized membrane protein YqiK